MNITDIDDKIIMRSNERKIKFEELSRNFENEFLNDCDNLNIRLPAVITRVSEYMPEIVKYIETIITNGFAYESNGSVYFDVHKYSNSDNHSYAKLDPSKVGDFTALAEGEGALTAENAASDKKNQ